MNHLSPRIPFVLIDHNLTKSTESLSFAHSIRQNPIFANSHLILMSQTPLRNLPSSVYSAFNGFIAKPLRFYQLINEISALNSGKKTFLQTKETLSETTETLLAANLIPQLNNPLVVNHRKTKALLAEDNIVNQKVALKMLEKLGIDVDIANNGQEAVKMFEDKTYDLIFMDCQMPEMDGFDATRTIRGLEQKNDKPPTPIIALTANALEGDKNQCLAAGMTDFLAKPLKQEALHNLLKKYPI
jgi:CheY-like chemotaxis protein